MNNINIFAPVYFTWNKLHACYNTPVIELADGSSKGVQFLAKAALGLKRGGLTIAFLVATIAMGIFSIISLPFRQSQKQIDPLKACQVNASSKPLHIPKESMISYMFSGGRFGDCLVTYLHAKWLQYKYKLPLAFKPFEFSDLLAMSEIEKQYDESQFKAVKSHGNESPFTTLSRKSEEQRKSELVLHNIHYFPESPSERGPHYRGAYIKVDWSDPGFRAEIAKTLKPNVDLNLVTPPVDRFSIAVHWRKGSGEDLNITQNYYPAKFPPDQFYLDQLVKICRMNSSKKLYIHLFSDHKDPQILIDKIKQAIKQAGLTCDIEFALRTCETTKYPVLEDFFSMAKFDCLLRSESAFSIASQFIGHHKLVIGPTHFHTEVDHKNNTGNLVIDQIGIIENGIERRESVEYRWSFVNNGPLTQYTKHHEGVFGL